jgi:acylphosphatase
MAIRLSMADTIERLSAIIQGRVQGVSFRYYTQAYAAQLGLGGWVKNLPDGSVAVWAEGPRADLEKLHQWLQHGPPSARVQNVQAEWGLAERGQAVPHFEVRY